MDPKGRVVAQAATKAAEKEVERKVCVPAQKTEIGAVSDHVSGSFCRRPCRKVMAHHLDGREVPQEWLEFPNILAGNPRETLEDW